MTATTAPPKADPQLDELCVNTIRTLAMDAVQKANSGHPGTPMALAPIAYVLYTRIMRHAHAQFPTVPLMIVAKEISLEDVRLGLEKMPDRFLEHPATVLVITNLNYSEAPRLMPRAGSATAARP